MKERILEISDKVSEYSLYGLFIAIPFSKAAIEICATLAISAFVLKKICMPEFGFLKKGFNFFLLFFVFFSGLSLFNSGPYLKLSLETLIFKYLEYVLVFIAVQDTFISERRIKKAIFILLITGVVVGLDAFLQPIFGIDAIRQRPMILIRRGLYALTGPFGYYNAFAIYSVVILVMLLAKFFTTCKIMKVPGAEQSEIKNRCTQRFVYPFFLVMAIILLQLCLFFTFSRGAWLGLLAALFLMLLLLKKRKVVFFVIAIFILGYIFIPLIRERAMFTFSPRGDKGRFVMWQGTWEIISENPFLGKGLGTFREYSVGYLKNMDITYAHNCYLQIWAETGLFSLLSFLAFLSSLLWKGIKAFQKLNDYMLLGLVSGIFAFLIHSFFDVHLYSLQMAVLFWSVLGLLAARIDLVENLIISRERKR